MNDKHEWFTDDVAEQIAFSARRVGRRYRSVGVADLQQEGMVWLFAHPTKMHEWMNDTDNPKRGWARFTRGVEGAMARAARAEKAHREGYSLDDEVFYAIGHLELILPALWDKDYRVNGPQREDTERIMSSVAPSEGNTWAAMVADAEHAWRAADLDGREESMLRMRYGPSRATFAQIARAHECTQSTAETCIRRVLRKLQRELGGPRPAECGRSCEDCGDGPGSRRAITNAHAIALTEREYE